MESPIDDSPQIPDLSSDYPLTEAQIAEQRETNDPAMSWLG